MVVWDNTGGSHMGPQRGPRQGHRGHGVVWGPQGGATGGLGVTEGPQDGRGHREGPQGVGVTKGQQRGACCSRGKIQYLKFGVVSLQCKVRGRIYLNVCLENKGDSPFFSGSFWFFGVFVK